MASTVKSYNPLNTGLTRDIYGTYKGHIWDLQGTYKGLTMDIYGTYKGHILDLQGTYIGLTRDKFYNIYIYA